MFIVEMAWGRPDQIEVVDMDADGDLYVDEFFRDPDPEWRFFSCHAFVWDQLLALGREYDWQPGGTLASERSREAWARRRNGYQNDYRPDEWLYAKQVTAADAAAWADALTRAVADGGLSTSR